MRDREHEECKMKTAGGYYSEMAEEYDSIYEQPFFRVYAAIELAFVRQYLPDRCNGVIHDAAGSTGVMSIPLAEEGYQVCLTDISPELIAKATSKARERELPNFCAVVANMESLPFEDSLFDLVVCLGNPLSYCDHGEVLREFHRTMKDGAALVATVENRLFLARGCIWKASLESIRRVIDTGDIASPFPMHGFTVQELTQVLETLGFKIERIAALPLLAGIKPDIAVDAAITDPAALDQLVALELQYCERREWLEAGKNILFCCKKPDVFCDHTLHDAICGRKVE